jgi:hypothetical protein
LPTVATTDVYFIAPIWRPRWKFPVRLQGLCGSAIQLRPKIKSTKISPAHEKQNSPMKKCRTHGRGLPVSDIAIPKYRNGNAITCSTCGTPLAPKRGSRRQRYCGRACKRAGRPSQNKQAHSMARKGITPETPADASKSARPNRRPVTVRSIENKLANSVTYKRDFAGGGSIPRYVIDIEVMGGRIWVPIVSADGVHSLQTILRPSALVRGSKA